MGDLLTLFTRAAKLMRGAADAALSHYGVRVGQNLLLEELWRSDGLTPGEMAQRLRVTTPTVVKMATRMEATGLLSRRRDPRDARLVRLYLTERGRSLQEAIERELEDLEARATATLDERERRHLSSALAKMIGNLERDIPLDSDNEIV
jgi:MarR family transcriptional regulator, organic hydroperoxide resistance regulator